MAETKEGGREGESEGGIEGGGREGIFCYSLVTIYLVYAPKLTLNDPRLL